MSRNTHTILSKPWVKALLSEPVLARLGTCNSLTLQPHVVPVWFEWDGEALYISAFQSTRKVRDIEKSTRISVLIDTDRPGEPARAVLLEGSAELLSDPALIAPLATSIYTRYMGPEGVLTAEPQSWISDPENRIIKLIPEKAFAWGPPES